VNPPAPDLSSALAAAAADRDAALERLKAFLRIPSVSTKDAHTSDVAAAAQWLADRMTDIGIGQVRIDATDGHPVVTGRVAAREAGAPTVLVYGHYDVQPPDPLDGWSTPPFEPTLREGSLYARGASDDKGQLMIHVEAAAAWRAAGGSPVNVVYVFEGEEEIGSPSLAGWLREHSEELAADVAVVSDTAGVGPDQPSIVVSLRGLAYLEIEVRGPNRDLHSGQFGGAVRNPAIALAQILAGLQDVDGRVTIPGFYDRVRDLTDAERADMAAVPFDRAMFDAAAGAAGDFGEPGWSIQERIGARPSLDVNGLLSGWTEPGAKTVLPATAMAKVSMRLVPDQDPGRIAELVRAHVERLAPPGVSVTVSDLHGAQPAAVERDTPALAAAAAAYERAFGRAPVLAREGGSIPVVSDLASILGLQTVLMGFGLPDDNLHAPDEKFDLTQFNRGIDTVIAFLDELARLERGNAG